MPVPKGWLAVGSNYTCNVRYSDAYGAWSPWSPAYNLLVSTNQAKLTVTTPYGQTVPAAGTNWFDYSTVTMRWVMNSPVTSGTTQYVPAAGGPGAAACRPAVKRSTRGLFSITNHSSISWLWKTNYWLDTATVGTGTVNVPDGWWPKGSNAQITATADALSLFTRWSGQTNGCTIKSNVITAPMTSPRAITANFMRGVVVTAATNPPAAGTVTGGGVFMPGSNKVALVAKTNAGWRFDKWSDGSTNATHATLLNLNNDTNFVARFHSTRHGDGQSRSDNGRHGDRRRDL